MKRALVTGARGFVGRHCLPLLVERGYEVHAVSTASGRPQADVHWHDANLLDTAHVRNLVASVQPSHLLHLAWYTAHREFWSSPHNLEWVAATLALAREFTASGRRIVTAGTCAEYDWGHGVCSESTPRNPATLYGASKHAVDVVLERYSETTGVSYASGKLFLLYGPHEGPQRFVPSLARALVAGSPAHCRHPEHVRDLLHVRDAADALVALLDDDDARGAFNIASGVPVTLGDVTCRLAAIVGRADLVRLGTAAAGNEPRELTADVSRITQQLAWSPRSSLDAGLAEVIEWWTGRLACDGAGQ